MRSRRRRRSTRCSSRRWFDAKWSMRGDAFDFEITGDSFLRHMVRTLVGTMLVHGADGLALLLVVHRAGRGPDRAALGAVPRWRAYD